MDPILASVELENIPALANEEGAVGGKLDVVKGLKMVGKIDL